MHHAPRGLILPASVVVEADRVVEDRRQQLQEIAHDFRKAGYTGHLRSNAPHVNGVFAVHVSDRGLLRMVRVAGARYHYFRGLGMLRVSGGNARVPRWAVMLYEAASAAANGAPKRVPEMIALACASRAMFMVVHRPPWLRVELYKHCAVLAGAGWAPFAAYVAGAWVAFVADHPQLHAELRKVAGGAQL